MKNEERYTTLVLELQSNHCYPARIKKVSKKSETTIGLSVDCIPILKESKLNHVKSVVGSECDVQYIPNKNVIEVTLKKK